MRTRSFATLGCLAALAAAGGCGDDEPTTSTAAGTASTAPETAATSTSTTTAEGARGDRDGRKRAGGEERPPKPQPPEEVKQDAAERAEAAYAAYIEAINERDGATLCELLPPGVEGELRPPVERGDCAARLGGSIGYEDPRGYPVWTETILNDVLRTSIGSDPGTARVTASIVTRFRGREPSVEDDLAYLELVAGEWRLAQPTAALYRAIGRPELPPEIIAPPGG